MIPFALFMFRIIWPEEVLSVRVNDPKKDGFTFEVASKRINDMKKPARYMVSFLDRNTRTYNEYEVTGKIEGFGTKYTFKSKDQRFINDFQKMINDYMMMIKTKTENDEIESMRRLSGIKVSNDFDRDIYSFKKRLCQPLPQDDLDMAAIKQGYSDVMHSITYSTKSYVKKTNERKAVVDAKRDGTESYVDKVADIFDVLLCKPDTISENELKSRRRYQELLPVEIAICLDDDNMINEFLKRRTEEFINYYWIENCLDQNFIADYPVTHVYIGNQFCPYLFPNKEQMIQIINKALEAELVPVIALAPIPENMISTVREILTEVFKISNNKKLNLELIINDYGVIELINEINPAKTHTLTAGILLNKRKKDPRLDQYENGKLVQANNGNNLFNDDLISKELHDKYGINNISYEVCGYKVRINSKGGILHLPRYQTNTSNCVLNSLMTSGDRGVRGDLRSCPHFCKNKYIFYPTNMNLIGIGNSMFSVSEREIKDFEYLNALITDGLKRLVVRL